MFVPLHNLRKKKKSNEKHSFVHCCNHKIANIFTLAQKKKNHLLEDSQNVDCNESREWGVSGHETKINGREK